MVELILAAVALLGGIVAIVIVARFVKVILWAIMAGVMVGVSIYYALPLIFRLLYRYI